MTTVKYCNFFACLLALFSISISCSDEAPHPNTKRFGGTFSATLDGAPVAVSRNSIYIFQGIFDFEAEGQGFRLRMEIHTGIAETSYEVGSREIVVSHSDEGVAESGTIVITEINEQRKTMSGTVNVLFASSSLANGEFKDIPYVIQQEETGNDYVAKIDGVEFRGTQGAYGYGSSGFDVSYENGQRLIQFYCNYEDPENPPTEFTFSPATDAIVWLEFIDGYKTYRAVSGTATVVSDDPATRTVTGTFSAVVEAIPLGGETKTITEGKFSYKY